MKKPAWYLVEGTVKVASSAVSGGVVQLADGLALPVLPSGRVHEIVCGIDPSTVPAPLRVQRLGGFERWWRMLWCGFWTWRRLSAGQRRRSGLTLWRLLTDLPDAYRIATRWRGMTYAQWMAEAEARIQADWLASTAEVSPLPRIVVHRLGEASHFPSLGAGDWLMLLAPGDRLAEVATTCFAREAARHPDAALIYADDDEWEGDGQRVRPRFKPDWSRLHLDEIDYIGRACIFSPMALRIAGGLKPENLAGDTWELLRRVGGIAYGQVRHIPLVLLHRDAAYEARHPAQRCRVHFPLPPDPPLVSIIIPTRDQVELLSRCIESVLERNDYPNYEILVVDNQSTCPDTLAYLQALERLPLVRVLRYARRFNFSAINNFAARQARGEVLCLLNNDTEVITPGWLSEMVSHLVQDRVGCVGCRLLYPDGRVQHAGDTVGRGGCANHLHEGILRYDSGYCQRAIVSQDLSAVTAACMVTWRMHYLGMGGLNERFLPVAFNDVDYCLRMREAGFRVVFTPYAELFHHESASRGALRGWRQELRAWREVKYMRWRWHRAMRHDPYYNPNFSHLRADFVLGPTMQWAFS